MTRRIIVAAVLLLASCAVLRPVPGGFAVEPASAQAAPGDVVRLAAQVIPGAPPVTWTTSAGTITSAGVLTVPGCTATLPLTVTVTATSGTSTATSTVQVDDKVTGVTVTPSAASVAPGGTVTFTATVKTVCNPAGVTAALRVAPSAQAMRK